MNNRYLKSGYRLVELVKISSPGSKEKVHLTYIIEANSGEFGGWVELEIFNDLEKAKKSLDALRDKEIIQVSRRVLDV